MSSSSSSSSSASNLSSSSVPFPSGIIEFQPVDLLEGRPRQKIPVPSDGCCPLCGKQWPNKSRRPSDFARHIEGHENAKRWQCPQCNFATAQKSNCDTHIRTMHTHERNQVCEHCGCSWTDPAQRSRHKSMGLCPKMPPPLLQVDISSVGKVSTPRKRAAAPFPMVRSPSGRLIGPQELDVAFVMTELGNNGPGPIRRR